MTPPKRPRMADVARAANVNRITVSRALSNPDLVAPETLKRIREAIATTGYIPDQIARGMKSQSSRIVSLVTPPQMSGVYGATLERLSDELSKSGLIVNLFPVHDDPAEQEMVLRELAGWRPAAIVVFGAQLTEESERTLRHARVPLIELLAYYENAPGTCVGYDQVAATEMLTNHLLDRGYRKIGFVHSGRLVGRLNHMRLTGMDRAISQRGGTHHRHRAGDGVQEGMLAGLPRDGVAGMELLCKPSFQGGYDLMERLSAWDQHPEALLFGSDMVAVGALQYCLVHNIRLREDVALCAFDGIALTSVLRPQLTCLDFAYERVIAEGARQIVARVADGSLEGEKIRIPAHVLHRDST